MVSLRWLTSRKERSLMQHCAPTLRKYPGLTQCVLALARTELIVNTFEAKSVLAQHSHEHIQFGFALQGSFTLFVGPQETAYTIGSQRAYLLAPYVLHGGKQNSNETVFSLDVKLQLTHDFKYLAAISFFDPIVQEYHWGKRLSYLFPWLTCHFLIMSSDVDVQASKTCSYLLFAGTAQQPFGTIQHIESSLRLNFSQHGQYAVHIELSELSV